MVLYGSRPVEWHTVGTVRRPAAMEGHALETSTERFRNSERLPGLWADRIDGDQG